ncbi:hypothetical protein HQ545_03730, partial [Candidatus Woesearchaeota archaeon]|nr:hypothetical protein [Candidatus Woesearchaeota archaeon]
MNPNTNSKSRTVLFSGRKAQITVFMIIGIILLFSSALMLYIRGQVMEGIPDEFVPTVAEVPLEAQPIKIFVEDCMKRAATSALNQMGLHSGYLDPSNRDTSGKVFLQGISPTESDGLKMMDNDKSMMPYWWHMNSPNDCVGTCQFDSFRPALRKDAGEPSIEGQLDYFIENNLATCLDNFDIFRQTGFGIDINGPIVSDARITEEDVSLFLEYPISAQKSGKKIDINRYFIRLDINFKQIYDFSTEVTNTEIQKGFLEYYV